MSRRSNYMALAVILAAVLAWLGFRATAELANARAVATYSAAEAMLSHLGQASLPTRCDSQSWRRLDREEYIAAIESMVASRDMDTGYSKDARSQVVDAWGNEFKIDCRRSVSDACEWRVRSSGPDGIWASEDDLVFRR